MARRDFARGPLVERLAVLAEVHDALGLEAVLVRAAGDSDDGAVPDGVVVGRRRGHSDLGLASGEVVAGDGAVGDAVGVRADDEVGVLLGHGAQVALGVGLGLQDAVGGGRLAEAVGLVVDEQGALGVELEGGVARVARSLVVPEVAPRLADAVGAAGVGSVGAVRRGVLGDEPDELGADEIGGADERLGLALGDVLADDAQGFGDKFRARRDEADALLLALGLRGLRGLALGLGGVLDALLREALGLLGPVAALACEVPVSVLGRVSETDVARGLSGAVQRFGLLGLRAQERRDGDEHVAGEVPELLRLEGEDAVGGDVVGGDGGGVFHGGYGGL